MFSSDTALILIPCVDSNGKLKIFANKVPVIKSCTNIVQTYLQLSDAENNIFCITIVTVTFNSILKIFIYLGITKHFNVPPKNSFTLSQNV